jgi:hypothetical protein
MFIGHYKSVSSKSEFYSDGRSELNFPTQVEYKKERYLLTRTIQVSSKNQMKKIQETAKSYDIEFNVRLD